MSEHHPEHGTSQKKAILVLGMHRSGTSALTRVLNLCGASLPNHLMPPKEGNNETGFWESAIVSKLNDEILASVYSTWEDASIFPRAWFFSGLSDDFKKRAQGILIQEFGDSSFFVVKDPRIGRLVPFWTDALTRFGAQPSSVIIVRHPLEVAASLKTRDGFETSYSLLLWLQHFLCSERDSRNLPRTFVTYDQLLMNWRGVLSRIENDLQIPLPCLSHTAGTEIDAFLRLDLRHHQEKIDLFARPDVVNWVSKAFSWAKKACDGLKVAPEELDEIYRVFQEADQAFGPVLAFAKAERAICKSEVKSISYKVTQLTSNIQVKEKQISQLNLNLTAKEQQVSQLNTNLRAREGQLFQLEGRIGIEEKRASQMIADLMAEKEQTLLLSNKLKAKEEGENQLKNVLKAKEKQISKLQSRLKVLGSGIETREQQVSKLNASLESKEQQIAKLNAVLRTKEQENTQTAYALLLLEKKLASTYCSKSWQFTAPIRSFNRIVTKRTASMVIKILKLIYWTGTFQIGKRLRQLKLTSLLESSSLFDGNYYLATNSDVAQFSVDPLAHYIKHGVEEGRDPNPLFDTSYYLEQNPDIAKAGINPLAHYIKYGLEEGRDPNPLFDTSYYLEQNPDIAEAGINPLVHYIKYGVQEGRSPIYINDYQQWLSLRQLSQQKIKELETSARNLAYKPTISIIMPVFNTPETFLKKAIESVVEQVYPYWELCIADDASTKSWIKPILEEKALHDKRIKIVLREDNGHISKASNSALELATGDYVALLDHDDLLTKDALYEVAVLLNQHPEADMLYSDEDKVDEQGEFNEPFFKPDWCPDTFLSRMYTCHLGVYRRSLISQIGGFREGYEGSQDYDLVLRLTEKTNNIFHISKVLYHWRVHPESTASTVGTKSYSLEAGKKAIEDALVRREEPGKVVQTRNHHYIVRYQIKEPEQVSIIIPTRDQGDLLDRCLTSVFEKSTYSNFEIILVDNGTIEIKALDIIQFWLEKEPGRLKLFPNDIPFNYSKLNNYGVEKSTGNYLLFLNNDTEIITPDWIEAMVEQAQRPSIGAVGSMLLYPDNTIQHAGVIAGFGGVAGHSHKHFPANSSGYFDQLQTVNNYSALTAACLMCRRAAYEEVNGFEESLEVAFNDIDFCFKLLEKGYRNVYLPHVVLYHYESKSRGYEDNSMKKRRFQSESLHMKRKWNSIIRNDPCYNTNLSVKFYDFRLKQCLPVVKEFEHHI